MDCKIKLVKLEDKLMSISNNSTDKEMRQTIKLFVEDIKNGKYSLKEVIDILRSDGKELLKYNN